MSAVSVKCQYWTSLRGPGMKRQVFDPNWEEIRVHDSSQVALPGKKALLYWYKCALFEMPHCVSDLFKAQPSAQVAWCCLEFLRLCFWTRTLRSAMQQLQPTQIACLLATFWKGYSTPQKICLRNVWQIVVFFSISLIMTVAYLSPEWRLLDSEPVNQWDFFLRVAFGWSWQVFLCV